MKKRRIAIVAFLLCACMVIGIGYANITRKLKVSGNIATTASELEVYFTAAKATEGLAGTNLCTGATLDSNAKATAATFNTLKMSMPGDFASATFTIFNDMPSAVSVGHGGEADEPTIMSPTFDNLTEWFTITHEFKNASEGATISTDGKTVESLPADGTVDLVVTITLKPDCYFTDAAQNDTLQFTSYFTATALTATGN